MYIVKRLGSLGLIYFQRLNLVLATTSGLCLLGVMVIVTYEVVMRYFFDSPTNWVVEMSTYLVIASLFLSQAYAAQTERHVRMDFFVSKLSSRWQIRVDLLTSLVALFVWVIFSWSALRYALKAHEHSWKSSSAFGPPLWPILLTIAVSTILLCLQLLIIIKGHISHLSSKQEEQETDAQTNNVERG